MGRSRGGLTTKIHAVVDRNGLPVRLALTPGQDHDNALAPDLLANLKPRSLVLADRAYDADAIRKLVNEQDAFANIPPKRNRKDPICFSPFLYKARNRIERFFNRMKHFRRIATRYDKLAANYLAALKLASVRLWLRAYESTTYVGDPSKHLTRLADSLPLWVWAARRKLCAICSGCRTTPGRRWSRIYRITNRASRALMIGG